MIEIAQELKRHNAAVRREPADPQRQPVCLLLGARCVVAVLLQCRALLPARHGSLPACCEPRAAALPPRPRGGWPVLARQRRQVHSSRMPPHSMTSLCKMLPRGLRAARSIPAVGPTGGGMAAGKSTVREIIGKDVFWSQVHPRSMPA